MCVCVCVCMCMCDYFNHYISFIKRDYNDCTIRDPSLEYIYIYIYNIYIYIYINTVVTISHRGFVTNQMQYNLQSAQYM